MSESKESWGSTKQKQRKLNDVKEGRTVFIKNLSFDTTKESLEELMTNFGSVEYCLLCYDKETEFPKGTAFVKFKSFEAAEKCISLTAKKTLHLDGRNLQIQPALTRNEIKLKAEEDFYKNRDRRNLYLAKEGLIYPDSEAAEGVSQTDLAKRLTLEHRKRALLQNLHYFVSATRLCIHNLPDDVCDKKLKKLFLKAADDKEAVITEAKVMKNIKKSDGKLGKSKGFGFVAFKEHKHALKALRKINNNPQVFTASKRPIVEFCIENLIAIKKKLKNANKEKSMIEFKAPFLKNYKEEEYTYAGIKAKPFLKNEPIRPSKLNRKIYENIKALKERGKELKKMKRKQKVESFQQKQKLKKRKKN